jgi:tRNA G46 methylase TrmB
MSKKLSRKELEAWLEWALGRLEHILVIHAIPDGVEAGFGMGETLGALADQLPEAEKLSLYQSRRRELRKLYPRKNK